MEDQERARIGYTYSGRTFSVAEIEAIRDITSQREVYPSRSAISRAVCEALGWRKSNGGLKDVSCRVALKKMHEDGLIDLPPPREGAFKDRSVRITSASDPGPRITGSRGDLKDMHLHRVRSKDESRLYSELIRRYHYLGHTPLAGAQMRYLAYDKDRLLGALGYGAAAWRVAPRDRFIGWSDEERVKNLHLVVNNARFLILPWVRVRNLASSLLGMASRRLPDDWEEVYSYRPVLLETFVDEIFWGTCYRASNWIYLGQTKGRGKKERRGRRRDSPIKSIFVFPLRKDFRYHLGVTGP